MLDQSVFKQLKKRETYNSSCNRSKHFFFMCKERNVGESSILSFFLYQKKTGYPRFQPFREFPCILFNGCDEKLNHIQQRKLIGTSAVNLNFKRSPCVFDQIIQNESIKTRDTISYSCKIPWIIGYSTQFLFKISFIP